MLNKSGSHEARSSITTPSEVSPLDNLRFGATARRNAQRRQRRRRIALAVWALATIAVVAGVPLARTTALGLLERFASGERAQAARGGIVFGGDSDQPFLSDTRTELPSRQTPTPLKSNKQSMTPEAYAGKPVTAIIKMAGAEFGVDGDYLLSIAECESGLDPQAYNSAGYHGLFQYDDSTWSAYGYGSIWDPVAQARTTARLIAQGQASRWPNCT